MSDFTVVSNAVLVSLNSNSKMKYKNLVFLPKTSLYMPTSLRAIERLELLKPNLGIGWGCKRQLNFCSATECLGENRD